MQTFLPYSDYHQSMRSLDKYRLGNQVWREGVTIIRGGWKNHPASKMWKGHEYSLGQYLLAGCDVLDERKGVPGHYNELRDTIKLEMNKFPDTGMPSWIGSVDFHSSHRSNLLRKVTLAQQSAEEKQTTAKIKKAVYLTAWYNQFGWNEPSTLPYVWPV